MSRYAFTAMLAALALGATALIAATGPRPLKLSVLISAQASAPASGACTAVTYPLTCPSGPLNCECVMYTGSFNGTLGHGNLSRMELTLDNGDATPGKNCVPAFGIVSFPAGKRTGAITLDVAGALCASTPPGGKGTIGGGFDVDPMTSGVKGSGSMNGTQTDGAAKIRLLGALAAASAGATPTGTPTSVPTSGPTMVASPTATATSTLGLPLPTSTATSTTAASPTATSTSGLPLGL